MNISKLTLTFVLCTALTAYATETKKSYEEDFLIKTATATAQNGENGLKSVVAGELDRVTESAIKKFLVNNDGVTEVSIQGMTGYSPTYNLLLLRPVTESQDKTQNTFIQTSLFYEENRTTLNLGYGYRRLVYDKKLLTGINLFYDHEFPYDHQRVSIGGEIRTTIGEINVNYYKGISDWKKNKEGLDEKALGGYDAELAIALPYIPTAHARVKTFKWIGVEGGADLQGQTYSLTGIILPGLSIEAGRTYYDKQLSESNFVKVSYNIPLGSVKKASKPVILDEPYKLGNMEDKRFEKVRRENKIIKQVGKDIAITISGV